MTFLFCDVEGSTRFLQRHGRDQYATALTHTLACLRAAVADAQGQVIDTEGDSLFAVFVRPADATVAAGAAQAELAGHDLRVRMGIHTGEGARHEAGYVGLDVHLAARIAAAASGGQVLVSAATAERVVGPELVPLGEHWLKDIERPERLFQFGVGEFPPVRSLRQVHVPTPATPMIDRVRELDEVTAMVRRDEVRLVTIAGPGGAGKTRLAQAVADGLVTAYPDGTWWVWLASLRDADSVWGAVAQLLGARRPLRSFLADRRILLCLDNAEHLAGLNDGIDQILAACPGVDMLITSREPVSVPGEWVYLLEPLSRADAVELFVTRARAAGVEVEGDDCVLAICEQLDCLALAVELAAARVRVFSPATMLERLKADLPVLGSRAGAPEHQRTLDSTIRWSYELLNPDERALFLRLAVFVGGCTLGAVESVCRADIETLASLVDKQLVRSRGERYWMLETIRRFARARLAEAGESAFYEQRHGAWCLEVCEQAYDDLMLGTDMRWLAVFDDEAANVRIAISRALAGGMIPDAIRMASALSAYFEPRGQVSEARRVLDAVLAVADDRAFGPRTGADWFFWGASGLAGWQGDDDAARKLNERFAAIAEANGLPLWSARAELRRGILDLHTDPQRARTALERARELTARIDPEASDVHARAELELAELELAQGRLDPAAQLAEAALDSPFGRRPGYLRDAAQFLVAHIALERGDVPYARALLEETLVRYEEAGVTTVQDELSCLAATWIDDDPATAAELVGMAEQAADDTDTPIGTLWAQVGTRHATTRQKLGECLGADELDAAVVRGRELALTDLLSRTLFR